MRGKLRILSAEEGLVAMAFVGMAMLACLMPIHNDTWWHLRNGQEMIRTRAILFEDRFSFTEYGAFFWNHSWLSQLLLYPLYRAGGPVLLTAFCAVIVSTGWIMTWRLMRGDIAIRIVLFIVALSSATMIWSLRPQIFSIALLPLLTTLAMADRWLVIVPLVVVWTNLHAGVAMGLAVLVAGVIAAVIADREKLGKRIAGTLVAAAATLINPVGFTAWLEFGRSMARSRANHIEEWMAPSLAEGHLIFWVVGALYVWQLLARWRQLSKPEDRVLAMAALVALPLASSSVRNIPAFMMLVAPALSRLFTPRVGGSTSDVSRRRASVVPTLVVVTATVIVAVVVAESWTLRWSRLGWDPVSPSAAQAIASCPGPLYNSYEAGGPLIWYVPTQRVFIDSRQDQYPITLVQEATRVEATGDYHRLFDRYRFNCAAVRPASPMARALVQNGWAIAFSDPQWTVLTPPH